VVTRRNVELSPNNVDEAQSRPRVMDGLAEFAGLLCAVTEHRI
jgi:hypothetical protein